MGKHEQPDLTASAIKGGVTSRQRHDSAHKHVTGEAVHGPLRSGVDCFVTSPLELLEPF